MWCNLENRFRYPYYHRKSFPKAAGRKGGPSGDNIDKRNKGKEKQKMKSKITNRCLSLLLVICLVAALIPASAFAQEVPQTAETIAATTAAAEEYVTADTAANRNYYIIHFNADDVKDEVAAYYADGSSANITFTAYAKPGERGIYRDKKCTQKIDMLNIHGKDEDKYKSDQPKAVVESILKWHVTDRSELIYGNEGICGVEFVRDTSLYLTFEGYKQQVYDNEGKEILNTTLYDKEGRILSYTNHFTGGTYTAEYDDEGSVIKETTGEECTTEYEYEYKYVYKINKKVVSNKHLLQKTYPDRTTDVFTYYKGGLIESYTNRSGIKEEYEYDGAKRLRRTTTYGPDGKFLKEEKIEYKTSGSTTTVSVIYEDERRIVQEITSGFDDDGNRQEKVVALDAEGRSRTCIYNDKDYLMQTIDPYGNKTYFEYDSNGNLTKVKTQAVGSDKVVTNLVNEYEYYDESKRTIPTWVNKTAGIFQIPVVKEEEYKPSLKKITKRDGENNTSIYEYDKDGHLTKYTDQNGNETRYVYSDNTHLTKVIEPTQKETTFIYDKAGRLTEIENADGSRNVFEYDKYDRKVKESIIGDGVKVTRRYEYDCMNQVTNVYNIDSSGKETLFSHYEYDVAGNVIAYTDANGNSTEYTYDALGNLLTETDPMKNVTSYTYEYSLLEGHYRTVTDNNGTVVLKYDNVGNLTSARDKRHNTTYFKYDDNNRQIATIVRVGDEEIVTKFGYDTYGNVTSITQPNGGVVTNTYDKSNQLTSTTDARGFTEYREYDNAGNLKRLTDRNENITEYSYDEYNRLTQAKDALGMVIYTYDSMGRLTGAEALSNDGKTRISQGTVTYDAAGRVKTSANALAKDTDSKNKVTYEYDGMGRVSKETYEDGQSYTAYEYDNNGNVLTKTYVSKGETYTYTYKYDDNNRATTVCDPTGIKTEYEYTWSGLVKKETIKDEAGNVLSSIEYTYDKNENVESVKDLLGDSEIHYTYDERNLVKTVTDERDNVYSYSYDKSGNLIEVVNPDKSKETYTYDENNNLKTSKICGKYTVYQYDRNGNVELVKFKNNLGEGENTVYYRYDARNRKTYERNSAGGVVSYTYDILNRVNQVKVSDNGGYYPGIVKMDEAITTYEYDAKGRVVKITDAEGHSRSFVYDEMDCVTQETDENGHTTSYAYDGLGNIVWVKDSLGHVQKYSYDLRGNCISYKDAEEREYTYKYDGLNRMISQTDPEKNTRYYKYDSLGNVTWEMDENGNETTYVYDKSGNVEEKRDALGNITRVSYDSMNRPTSVTQVSEDGEERTLVSYTYNERGIVETETNANEKTKSYEYDDNGNLTLMVDENGNKTQYTYDNRLNLISSINYGNKKVTFAYDAAGNLRQMSDQTGTTTIGVDLLGRIKQVTNPSGNTLSYTYDNVGNLLKTAYSGDNGAEVNYEYDSENRLVSIKDSVAGKTTLSYDDSGLLTEKTFENGERQEYTYDKRGYISQLDEFTAEGQRYQTTYRYDPAGNRTDTVRYAYNSDTGVLEQERYEHYDYDHLNRIRSSTDGTHSVNYEYDGFGNLIRESGDEGETIYSYNAMNQLVGKKGPDGKESYTYDYAGNRISMTTKEGTFRYYYDRENRLEEVYTPDGQYEKYVYNGLGMRTERISSEKNARQHLREEYVVDFTSMENNDLYVHVTGDNDKYTKRYVYAQGERIAQVTDDPTGKIERLLYVHEDIMGSMGYMTGKDASLYARAEYKLWGEPEVSEDILKDKAVDIYFTGHPYDAMTGMYFAEARFYDPDTRSFISIDPAKDGVNWYQYCGANPATYWDPTGLSFKKWWNIAKNSLAEFGTWLMENPCEELLTDADAAEWVSDHPEIILLEGMKGASLITGVALAVACPWSWPVLLAGGSLLIAEQVAEYVLQQRVYGEEIDLGQMGKIIAIGAIECVLMAVGAAGFVGLAEAARLIKPLQMCATDARKIAQFAERWVIGTAGAFDVGVAVEVTENLFEGKSLDESICETLQNSSSILLNAALISVASVRASEMTAPKCFTAGTLVLTEEGPVAIEEIQAGDKVLAFDEETGEIAYKEVVQTFENTTDELTYVTVETEDGETETIESTPGHPYYVKEEKDFVKAYLLEEGTELTLADGRTAYVKEVVTEELTEPVAVYNFEVADFHTYYVGENSVLVHNWNCWLFGRGPGNNEGRAWPIDESRLLIRIRSEDETILRVQIEDSMSAEDINLLMRQEYAKKYFVSEDGYVNYAGLDDYAMREINSALRDVYNQFDKLNKLKAIIPLDASILEKYPSGEDAMAIVFGDDRLLVINQKYWGGKGIEIRDSYFRGVVAIKKGYSFFRNMRGLQIGEGFSARRWDGGSYDNSSGRAQVGYSMKDIIYHEMGHHLHFTVLDRDPQKIELINGNMSKYAGRVSRYAQENLKEYIAESFASYMKGENVIDPELRKIFDKLGRYPRPARYRKYEPVPYFII